MSKTPLADEIFTIIHAFTDAERRARIRELAKEVAALEERNGNTIPIKWNRGDEVLITEIKTIGIVVALFYGRNELEYNIRYCFGGAYKTEYFFEFELEAKK